MTGVQALPALFWASALGNSQASAMAGQIIGQTISDALKPSFEALALLRGMQEQDR
jgi:NifU-like protein involved in Fe-S cluster formation